VSVEWVLLKVLADELGIPPGHPDRWSIWTTATFRPTRITVTSKTGVVRRWAVTTEQAQRLRELQASAVAIN
jgi:hypothetical protein